MPTVQKWYPGNSVAVLSTALNGLPNNGMAASSAQDTDGADGSILADVEFVGTLAGVPTVGSGLSIWFLRTLNGTQWEDGSDASVIPARPPDLVLPLRTVSTAQRVCRTAVLPASNWRALLRNDGTGQALSSSGNVLNIRPVTTQTVVF